MNKRKGFNSFIQFIQNTLAYALPVFFQQFIVYPLMANKLGEEANGQFLALIALNYFTINITISVLVNVRLLRNRKYEEEKHKGDFNLLLLFMAVIDTFIIIGGTIFYGQRNLQDLLLSVVLLLLFVYHDYVVVQYRIELRFRDILINNLILCVGYILGLIILYTSFRCWQIVFIVPYLMTMIYDMTHTNYIKEPLKKTPLINDTVKQYFLLMGSTLLSAVVTYGDRMLLYPILGGDDVSVFTSAQLIGKILQLISTPVSSFMLAHLVKKEKICFSVRPKYVTLLLGVIITLYIGGLIVGRPVIYLLYPTWADEAITYIPLTTANGIVHMLNVLLNVVVLRFCKAHWQIIKSMLYLMAYTLLSFSLMSYWGLWGFGIGNLLASLIEVVFLLGVLFGEKIFTFKKKQHSNIDEI